MQVRRPADLRSSASRRSRGPTCASTARRVPNADAEATCIVATPPCWPARSSSGSSALDQPRRPGRSPRSTTGRCSIIGTDVELRLSRNTGGAFSLFQGFTPLLAVLAIVLTVRAGPGGAPRRGPAGSVVALALVLGGAIGNLVDRIARAPGLPRGRGGRLREASAASRRSTSPTAAITIGAVLLVVRVVFGERSEDGASSLARAGAEADQPSATTSRSSCPQALDGERRRPRGRAPHRVEPEPRCRRSSRRRGARRRRGRRRRATASRRERSSRCSASPPPAALPRPEAGAVEVRYADDDVIVVDKPAGLVVHPGAGHAHGTLVHGLLARLPGDRRGRRPGAAGHRAPPRPGHERAARRRADRARVRARSSTRSRARDVERRYLALVWGSPRVAAGGRRRADRAVDAAAHADGRARAGRPARTAYEVVAAWRDAGVAPPRVRPRDRPHPPDPGAPRRHRASRWSATGRTAARRPGLEPGPAVPARRPGSRSPTRGTGRRRSRSRCPSCRAVAARRSAGRARPAGRLTTGGPHDWAGHRRGSAP